MEPAGTVEALRGEATAQSRSDIRSLAQNALLFVSDWVVTGKQSGIAMRLGTTTEVRLRIDRFLG
jgi:hypothetical protein